MRIHDREERAGEEYELEDRMHRRARDSFVLMVAGDRPGDPEVELAYSLEDVFGWYRDCPEQIERAVPTFATKLPGVDSSSSPLICTADFGELGLFAASSQLLLDFRPLIWVSGWRYSRSGLVQDIRGPPNVSGGIAGGRVRRHVQKGLPQ
jgi:hypothetical protein